MSSQICHQKECDSFMNKHWSHIIRNGLPLNLARQPVHVAFWHPQYMWQNRPRHNEPSINHHTLQSIIYLFILCCRTNINPHSVYEVWHNIPSRHGRWLLSTTGILFINLYCIYPELSHIWLLCRGNGGWEVCLRLLWIVTAGNQTSDFIIKVAGSDTFTNKATHKGRP